MEKWLKDILPILDVEHDAILSKQGDITFAFQVELPEIFSLSAEEYETLHQGWVKALKILPRHSVFHKQDWFLQRRFEPPAIEKASFLQEAADRHFRGRPYLEHTCYIFLTKKPEGRKLSTSLFSNLIRPTIVPEQALKPELFRQFQDAIGQFHRILEDTGFLKLRQLKNEDFVSATRKNGLIEHYYSLSEQDSFLIKDVELGNPMKIGDQYCQLYTLGDAQDMPALCGPRITYDKYSTDRTKFSIGFASSLGLLLPFNHLYNQYIFIDDAQKTLAKLEKKRLRLQSLSAYSRENTIARDATNEFLNEAISQQRLPVRAHYNVQVWTDDVAQMKELKNQVSSALAKMDAVAKQETVGAPQIWWAGIPGNASDFPSNDTFDTFLEQSTCFLNNEGNPRSASPSTGIRFCDRISSRPVYIDLFDAPRRSGITSNMGTLVCGTSGGGKSMTINHVLHSLYQQGAHCVILDIGGSYKALCSLLGGYYFTYEEKNPIKFNPFYLQPGEILDTEKKESLKSLLVALWKQESESFNRSEYVALSNALQGYYQHLSNHPDVFPCFNTFYEYLQEYYIKELQGYNVKDKDFDVNNFLYVLMPFYKGGEFDFLLNATEQLDMLNQPFVVIEIDNIKDNPILFPVATLVVVELFISKMRKLPGVRKVLTIDEAWKAIAKAGMAEFIKYAFKTIRKFNGIPIVITQELDDLVSSPVIKDAIINNADIKVLMDMRKFMNKFDRLQETLGQSDKGKTILLSVNKDDREIFIDIGGVIMRVYRNELCPEEYYAFTTEGRERVKVLEYAQRYGSMEKGIAALTAEQKQ